MSHSRMYAELQDKIFTNKFDRIVTSLGAILIAGIIAYTIYEIIKTIHIA